MKRIFYYSGFRLKIFHWAGNKFISSYTFNPDDDGHVKFEQYLRQSENTPARILVDVIEEEYKQESIPHVGSKDRKAIVSRLIERQYRDSKDYAHYKIIGREKNSRKDDIIQYSVLTNPLLMKPWLDIIEETNTSISGIWSVPLLAENLIKKMGLVEENILLITRQVQSVMRLSLFKKGKFELSRTARISSDGAPMGLLISLEAEQTINYLANQKYLGFDDKLTVHVINNEEDLPLLQEMCIDTPLRKYAFHDIEQAQDDLGCEDFHGKNCGGIYSYVCAEQLIPKGHYGHSSSFKKYYQQIIASAFNYASIVLIVISLIVMAVYISEADTVKQKTIVTNNHAIALENEYVKSFNAIEPTLEITPGIKSIVLWNENLAQRNKATPQNFMNQVSRILTLSGMKDTEITSIEWGRKQSNDLPVPVNSRRRAPVIVSEGISYANDTEIKHEATIKGYIRISNISIKEASKKVDHMVEAFKNNKLVEHIEVLTMPLDSRPDVKLEQTSGTTVDKSGDDSIRGFFELKVVMSAG